MKVFSFGDSWAAGAELRPGQKTFSQLIAEELNVEHTTFSKEGFSLGQIMFSIFQNHESLTKDDIVLVIVPPDTRWYNMNTQTAPEMYSIMGGMIEWFEFAKDKPLDWFILHHNLFIYTIQTILSKKGCKFLLAHNYGRLEILPQFKSLIDTDLFLSDKSLTYSLVNSDWDNYNKLKEDCPPNEYFTGPYFLGNKTHPNQYGHQQIAKLLMEKLNVK